jgi:PPM family protein phosphatase
MEDGAPRVGAHTDRGTTHTRNQDAWLADPAAGLFAVADGMGGHPAGDVASRTAIEHLPRLVAAELADTNRVRPAIERAILELNEVVLASASDEPGRAGMGTTLVLAQLVGRTAYVGNVGDSRAYVYSRNALRKLTEDQTFAAELIQAGVLDVEEASRHPFAHSLAHAIGRPDIRPETSKLSISDGDRLLLCSDGLTKPLSDDQIAAVLADEPDPERACRALVRAARDAGERDDITVVVVDPG